MASRHQLSLEVPDTNNVKVLRVFDISLYSNLLPVECGVLQITSPGFNHPKSIEILPNFNLVLNGCTLGIQERGCGSDAEALPDGIYKIHYSVSPNSAVFVEYQHLRITSTLNTYFNQMCKVEVAACEPDSDVKAQLEELRLIKDYLDAAKIKVEYCHDSAAGTELFLYAQNKLRKYSNECH